jgi:hypothetical protein
LPLPVFTLFKLLRFHPLQLAYEEQR